MKYRPPHIPDDNISANNQNGEVNPFSNAFIYGNEHFKILKIKTIRSLNIHFRKQKAKSVTAIIPEEWYSENGFLPAIVAGYLDTLYRNGDSFTDTAQFLFEYFSSEKYRREFLNSCFEWYHNPEKLRENIVFSVDENINDALFRFDTAKNQYDIGGVIAILVSNQANQNNRSRFS